MAVVARLVARDPEIDEVAVAYGEEPEPALGIGSFGFVQIAHPDPVDFHAASRALHTPASRSAIETPQA